ncbi:MAG: hypothetical protein ACI93P_000226 [bacterium]|jgi:hypothetical protein
MASFQGTPNLVLKVHFYDLRPEQLPQTHPFLTETEILNAVAELNKNFNASNIFFKYDGMDYFENDDFYDIIDDDNRPAFKEYLYDNDLYVTGAVNVYSVTDLDGAGAAQHFGGPKGAVYGGIISDFDNIDNPTVPYVLTHETGHMLGLKHTFYNGTETNPGALTENVARVGEPNFNADTHGDKIIDTYATPLSYTRTNCVYTDNQQDPMGRYYSDYPPQAKNFMSYAHYCQQEFTAGQVSTMRAYINLVVGLPNVTAIEINPVEILYQPYKGEYYLAGPLPVDEDGHLNPPKFQYGFDYVFYDTSQAEVWNQPTSWGNTNFWYGSVTQSFDVNHNSPILHPNHTAFKILQIDGNYPRMCYNNYNRAPSGGTIIKFLDNVTNANVNISSQDSTSINNPNLINNLDPGLYNIIENYDDGGSQETMIYKENN